MLRRFLAATAYLLMATVVQAGTPSAPPVAAKKSHQVTAPFGAARADEYYWLRDDTRKSSEVFSYLSAENAYADAQLAHLKPLKDALFKEITSRIAPDDSSVPYRQRGYLYYRRFAAGQDYPVITRRKGLMAAPEEVLLDEPAMAKGKTFFEVGTWEVSPDNRFVAYAEDTIGRRQFVLKVKDIASGKVIDDVVTNIEDDVVWSDDNRTIYYIDKDPVTLLSKRVKAHVVGTPVSQDRLVHEENDDSFYISLKRTTSDKYACIFLWSTTSNEVRCAPASGKGEFAVFAPRQKGWLYDVDHVRERWLIWSNHDAPNYRLMTLPDTAPTADRSRWHDLVAPSTTAFIEAFKPFNGFVAIEERVDGNKRIRLLVNDSKSTPVVADEPAYTMTLDTNAEPTTDWLRYRYESMVTPPTIYEVNAKTGERRMLKQQPVPGYAPSQYVTERVWATARDGTKVPVSLVHHRKFDRNGTAALYQVGYGAYGSSYDPEFNIAWPSLADRGMVVAIAQIRGGQDMGRAWYDDGHLMKKMNSFTDFIDVTRHLVDQKYAAAHRTAGFGRSAGGLLMGAVANMAPEDYGVIVTQVPFVDAVTTMLDPTIPLTTNEYDEWGNPGQKPFYDYILGYSPYDNVAAKRYPALYVSTGLWDSQVQYYEPAKWVARLRAKKTDDHPLLFRIQMEAGHGGKSGRFRRYEEQAEYLAFMMDQLDVAQ